MAKKTAASAVQAPEFITLDYRLSDLPTAQHKAGLAGLVLMIQALAEREIEPRPEMGALSAEGVSITLSAASLQTLLDDWFDAEVREISVRNKQGGRTLKREDYQEITDGEGKVSRERRFVYDNETPLGRCFAWFLDGGDTSPWLGLWREMLWQVLYAQPTTRGPFSARATGQPVKLATEIWQQLVKATGQPSSRDARSAPLSGPLFIGAQAVNAERVPFQGAIQQNLLLYFWTLASPVFLPQITNTRDAKRERKGHLLVVPELANLKRFVSQLRRYWQRCANETVGWHPRAALVDVVAEAGFEFLVQLAYAQIEQEPLHRQVSTVELYHLERQGNNVQVLSTQRIVPAPGLVDRYKALRDPRANPFWKQLVIGNLLDGNPRWFDGATELFEPHPWELFIHTDHAMRFRFFGSDARRRFESLIKDLEKIPTMSTETDPALNRLARRIFRMVWAYVDRRTDERSHIKRAELARNADNHVIYPEEYRNARQKVCSDAFLAMRGRHGADFTAYFTGTVCAVPHYLGEDEFLEVSQYLIEDPLTVKNLAMLALSAHSYLPGGKQNASDSAA